jgi:DNA-binding HxlR family transcriptional regulator
MQNVFRQSSHLATASDVLCSRWTVMLLAQLLHGKTRFNDLRRGLPRMSSALLSKRLRDLEVAGIVARVRVPGPLEFFEYELTDAGRDVGPVVDAMGVWGGRWVTISAGIDGHGGNH